MCRLMDNRAKTINYQSPPYPLDILLVTFTRKAKPGPHAKSCTLGHQHEIICQNSLPRTNKWEIVVEAYIRSSTILALSSTMYFTHNEKLMLEKIEVSKIYGVFQIRSE